jgi:hypothetical protein
LLSFGALMECVIIKNPELMMFEELVGSFKDSNNYQENMNLPSVLYRVQKFGRQFAGNKFCTVAPCVCGYSAWQLFHVTLLAC